MAIYIGWEQICKLCNCTSSKTATTYIRKFGFPVIHIGNRPFTTDGLVESWASSLMNQKLLDPMTEKEHKIKFKGREKRFGGVKGGRKKKVF